MEIPDGVLIERCRSGDRNAFEQIYRRYAAGVHGFVRTLVSNPEDAEDLTVATFIKAWNALGSLKDNAAFRTWLFRIALRLAQDHKKRSTKSEQLSDAARDPKADPEAEVYRHEAQRELAEAIDALSPEHRQVVSLYYGEEMSVAEIGRVLGLPKGTVVSRLARARVALKKSVCFRE